MTQQEFMYNVWEKLGLVVSANTYYQNICLLRKGMKEIGFTRDPITTIPRIGLTLALIHRFRPLNPLTRQHQTMMMDRQPMTQHCPYLMKS
ncbi:Uncharacterised protein [Raoultella terrigena]|nr:Uncharacterised protein [Raoultella terrigena]